jgi:GT2 family glycosyltransferase
MGYKIDIGSGKSKQPGCIGLDYEDFGQEIVRDLTKGLPFSDNSVSEVHLNHSLEHFRSGEEVWFLFSEIYRVCHAGATIHVRVPHSASPDAHNPSHLSYWSEESLMVFDRRSWPYASIPSKYFWDFEIGKIERNGIELQFELVTRKQKSYINPETGKVAIITVAYNQLQHTKKFIQSLRRNTLNPFKIIIVNNNSDDGTKEWLEEQEDIIAVNLEENLGWVGGINTGLKFIPADTDYIVFANNDVIVPNSWDRQLLNHFDDTVGAVGPTSNYVAGRQNKVFNHQGIYEEEVNTLIGFFMCVRKEIVDVVGPLDDLHSYAKDGAIVSGADDHDYSIRIRSLGYRLLCARDCFVYHAGSQSLKASLSDSEYRGLCQDADQALTEKWGESETSLLMQSPVRVLACVPMRNNYLHRKFAFTFSLMHKPFYWECVDMARAHVGVGRNAFVKFAKERQADYILFLDDDHILKPDTFLRLYRMNVPVATALAFQRVPPYWPCIYQWTMLPDNGQTACLPVDQLIKQGQRKVDASGFAAALIKMEVFDKIPDPWFEWKELGEDIDFCLKCKDHDIPIWCDTDLILPHIGENQEVDEQTFYAFNPVKKSA